MKRVLAFSLLAALSLWTFGATAQATEKTRPASWAQPIDLDGAPKLHRVAENFYRSAQPTAAGFAALEGLGVRTIISLRAFHSDQPLTRRLELRLARYPMHTWHIEREDVVAALRRLRLAMKQGPTLLHCEHGADRTGLITALYRVLYQGWSKEAALAEMRNGNFGFHAVWGNIPSFIRKVDVERLERDVDVP